MEENFVVSVIVWGPRGEIPLVRDPSKPLPHFWKFPGGHPNNGESPEQAALREVEEELGLRLDRRRLRQLLREERSGRNGKHFFFLFEAPSDLMDLKETGDEGEDIAVFTVSEIREAVDFFSPHRDLLKKLRRI